MSDANRKGDKFDWGPQPPHLLRKDAEELREQSHARKQPIALYVGVGVAAIVFLMLFVTVLVVCLVTYSKHDSQAPFASDETKLIPENEWKNIPNKAKANTAAVNQNYKDKQFLIEASQVILLQGNRPKDPVPMRSGPIRGGVAGARDAAQQAAFNQEQFPDFKKRVGMDTLALRGMKRDSDIDLCLGDKSSGMPILVRFDLSNPRNEALKTIKDGSCNLKIRGQVRRILVQDYYTMTIVFVDADAQLER